MTAMTASKGIEYYERLPYAVELVEDPDEGGYTAFYPDLPGCATCGETIDEAMANAKDAKREWLKAALEDGVDIAEPNETYSGQFRIRMPRSLHRSIALRARAEGVSMNQYCVYLLTQATSQKTVPMT